MRRTFTSLKNTVFTHRDLEPLGDAAPDNRLVFARLYDHYASLMLGVITKVVPDKAEAVLILEQAFITVRQQLDELKTSKQPLLICLMKIARRTASDALAKRRQRGVSSLHLTSTDKLTNTPQQKDNPLATGPIPENGLDAQQQTLLDDMLFNNCTPEEAAASAGIPVSQVRYQLRLAVQQLRNLPFRK